MGMDDDQLGEFAYDYVEVRRDYLAWTPAKDEPERQESHVNAQDMHGISQHSDMIHGMSPETSKKDSHENGRANGHGNGHAGVIGDRHGIAAEDQEKEKRGLVTPPNGTS